MKSVNQKSDLFYFLSYSQERKTNICKHFKLKIIWQEDNMFECIHIIQHFLSVKIYCLPSHYVVLKLSKLIWWKRISACCSFVLTALILIVLFLTYWQKWWYLTHVCCFLGLCFSLTANHKVLTLSSKVVEYVLICLFKNWWIHLSAQWHSLLAINLWHCAKEQCILLLLQIKQLLSAFYLPNK